MNCLSICLVVSKCIIYIYIIYIIYYIYKFFAISHSQLLLQIAMPVGHAWSVVLCVPMFSFAFYQLKT